MWTYDEAAGRYFYHKFYGFQPDLNLGNSDVREEIHRVLDYWLSFGISGFRVDAAPHMIAKNGVPGTEPTDPHGVLRGMYQAVTARRPDAVLLGETADGGLLFSSIGLIRADLNALNDRSRLKTFNP